jgi:hypothetical protein
MQYPLTNITWNSKKAIFTKPTPPKKKFNIQQYKKNTIHSLIETEQFLNNLQNFYKYIKLYKLLK